MKHSQKVLEAEKKRTTSSDMYLLPFSDGYLKHDRAFSDDQIIPLTSVENMNMYHSGSNKNSTERSDIHENKEDDDNDGKYNNEHVMRNDGNYHGHHHHHNNNNNICRNSMKHTERGKFSSSKSLSTSPTPKRQRHEEISRHAMDINGNMRRTTASIDVCKSPLTIKRKKSLSTNHITTTPKALRYRTSSSPHLSDGFVSPVIRTEGRYAASTISSRQKVNSPRKTNSTRVTSHSLMSGRMGRDPVTAGICSPKTGSYQPSPSAVTTTTAAAVVTDHGDYTSSTEKLNSIRNNEERMNIYDVLSPDNVACQSMPILHTSSTHIQKDNTTMATQTTSNMIPTVSSLGSTSLITKQCALVTSNLPLSPPLPTYPVCPPLRAVVSPRTHVYRQNCLATESPKSVTRTPPTYMGPNCLTPPSTGSPCGSTVTARPPLLLSPIADISERVLSPDGTTKGLRSNYTFKGPRYSLTTHHGSWEYSGFINPRNDCYACSVLTLLLRSSVFCQALFAAPLTNDDIHKIIYINSHKNEYDKSIKNNNFISSQFSYGFTFSNIHQVLFHFAFLLQKPKRIQNGLHLDPLQDFFPKSFFSGEQEDAHEFFLTLMDKLEEECIEMLTSNDRKRENYNTTALIEEETNILLNDNNILKTRNKIDNFVINPERIWINQLIRGKLLNIIRCKNEGCEHEIATEDVYINLSLNLMTAKSSRDYTSSLTQSFAINSEDISSRNIDNRSCTPPKEISHRLNFVKSPRDKTYVNDDVYDIQTLLNYTLRFVPLDTYVCDACGSSQRQQQGGCLLGMAPPLLVLQVKRFATTFDAVTGVNVSKDKTPVRVNEELTIYALQEEGQYDREKKQLTQCVREAERAAKEQYRQEQKLKEEELLLNQPIEKEYYNICSELNHKQSIDRKNNEPQKENTTETIDTTYVKAIRYLYRLQGLVLHMGSSPLAGHYIAEFLNSVSSIENVDTHESLQSENIHHSADSEEGKKLSHWSLADDVHVCLLSKECVLKRRSRSTDCYLLLYEKVEEKEVMCPVWCVLPSEV